MNGVTRQGRVRVLVIDDSAYNRQAIVDMLESDPAIQVVGRAVNGEQGLKDALILKPDVITLDLEMPKMDGFTFLRILLKRMPTPVIIISSYGKKQNVFKALELGAFDFIAKPSRYLTPEVHKIRDELVHKVKMIRKLRQTNLSGVLQERVFEPDHILSQDTSTSRIFSQSEPGLVLVGASTGGPPALQSIFKALAANLPLVYLVAQHMPANFTRAFAERLDKYSPLDVNEAKDGEDLYCGKVLVAPGGSHLKVVRKGSSLKTKVVKAGQETNYVPSIDILFQSAAQTAGSRSLAVLLTGMGSDGCIGMRSIKEAGGQTVAESEETAVIFGMPKEAIESGQVDKVVRLDEVPKTVLEFAQTAKVGKE